MNRKNAEEYTQSLGQIVAGSYRQIALAEELGVPKALGLSTRDWVQKRLGGYVKYSISERREAVAELADEGMSQRGIAEALGVSQRTVCNDLSEQNYSPIALEASNGARLVDESEQNYSPMDAIAALAATTEIRKGVERAEAKLGGTLAETVSHVSSRHDTSKRLPKGISRDMSSQCQTLHRNPEAIEVAIASAKEGERIPTKEAGGQKIKVITR